MMRYLTTAVLILAFAFLAGCKPPTSTSQKLELPGGGKDIATVEMNPKSPGEFKTVVIDGAELLQARGEVGKHGGTFHDNQIGDGPKTFNPWASFDATSSAMGAMMFPGLTTTDAYTGAVVPYLAREVSIKDDKMTYVVTLRKGLKWSDGEPFTSEDVVFTWNEIIKQGLGNPSTRDVLTIDGKFPNVRAIDEHTVEFKTAVPFAPFERMLSTEIAPSHIMRPVVQKGNQAFSSFWGVSDAANKPESFVSMGMWQLENYTNRQRVSFKRNPNFFMVDKKGQRLPYLDRYVISFVGDMNAQRLQFEQGKADVYAVPGNFVSDIRLLKKPDFRLYNLGPDTSTTFIAFNLNTRKEDGKPLVDPKKSRWFNDPNFRKAVSLAVNRDDLVDNILKGVGAPLYTAESLSSIYLNEDLSERLARDANDIEKAKALLKESGFSWTEQGRLKDKAGNLVTFSLYTNSGNNQREATGVNIKQDLESLGIQVDFKPMDFNVLVGKLNEGSWETMIMGLTGNQLEPHGGANIWKSNGGIHLFFQRAKPGQTPEQVDLSDRLPWEKELDELVDKGAKVFEKEDRQVVYNRLQEVVAEQNPMVYLYSGLRIVAVRNHLRNMDPTPLGGTTHNLEEIWIEGAGSAD